MLCGTKLTYHFVDFTPKPPAAGDAPTAPPLSVCAVRAGNIVLASVLCTDDANGRKFGALVAFEALQVRVRSVLSDVPAQLRTNI
jgi:hypothetical protein